VVAARLDAVAILRGESAQGPYRKLNEALRPVSDVERITARIAYGMRGRATCPRCAKR